MTARRLTEFPHDQQHLVHEVSERLAPRFAGVFGPETIERFVVDSMDQLLATAKTTAFLPLLTERFARERLQALGKVEGSLPSAVLPSSSSASTTRGAPRWQPDGCVSLPATVSSSTREVPSLPRRSTSLS